MSSERPLDEQVRLEYRGAVAWITINRPDAGNALNPPSRDRMRDILNELNTSHRARCAVIAGSGDRFFCTGADLRHSSTTAQHRRMMLAARCAVIAGSGDR